LFILTNTRFLTGIIVFVKKKNIFYDCYSNVIKKHQNSMFMFHVWLKDKKIINMIKSYSKSVLNFKKIDLNRIFIISINIFISYIYIMIENILLKFKQKLIIVFNNNVKTKK